MPNVPTCIELYVVLPGVDPLNFVAAICYEWAKALGKRYNYGYVIKIATLNQDDFGILSGFSN